MPSYYKGKDGAAAVPVQTPTRQRAPLATSYPMTEITSGYQVTRLFSVLGRTP